jgi:hypothetical protein
MKEFYFDVLFFYLIHNINTGGVEITMTSLIDCGYGGVLYIE